MRKIGLKSYFSLSLILAALLFCILLVGLWQASNDLTHTAREMNREIHSITAAQSILDRLHVHRRQSLLENLRSPTERREIRQEVEKSILADMAVIENIEIDPVEREIARQSLLMVDRYLQLAHAEIASGHTGSQLYATTSAQFDLAARNITEFIKASEVDALVLESLAENQSIRYRMWAVGLVGVMLTGMGIVSWSFLTLVFRPIMHLRAKIRGFTQSKIVPEMAPEPLREIDDINLAFVELVSTLERQREQRLLFLSSVAHDLKNPLGAIKMSISLLNDGQQDAQQRQITDIVNRQVQHLARLVEDLLDATRIESGHLNLNITRVELGPILRDSVQLFVPVSASHKIKFTQTDDRIYLPCDPNRMSQVFNNLLSNAIKYSPNGGEISVTMNREADVAIIAISDEGIGIEAADVDGIFEPFRRPSASRHKLPGVGLGLSTSKKIIEAHHGQIHVQSRPGRGTVFLLTLPIEPMVSISRTPEASI